MRERMNISSLTRPELEELKNLLNLTDDEEIIFELLSKGKSIKEISEKIRLSTRTVDNRILSIKNKISHIRKKGN